MEEIMNNVDVIDAEVIEESTKGGFAIPALIVLGVAGAGFGLYKLGKKIWTDYKTKKALEVKAESVEVVDDAKDSKRVK